MLFSDYNPSDVPITTIGQPVNATSPQESIAVVCTNGFPLHNTSGVP